MLELERVFNAYDKCCDELHDSIKYSKAAISMKVSNPTFAKNYHEMASDELKHANLLKAMIEKTLTDVATNGGMSPIIESLVESKNGLFYDKATKARVMLMNFEGKI